MVGTQLNRRAMRVYPMAGLLVLALVALALVPDGARAQTEPEWNSSNQIVLTPGGIETIGSYKCARWPDGNPQQFYVVGVLYELYGVCIERTASRATVRLHLSENSASEHLWFQKLQWSTDGGTDIVVDNRHWSRGNLPHNNGLDLFDQTPVSSTLGMTPTLVLESTHTLASCTERRWGTGVRNYDDEYSCLSADEFTSLSIDTSTTIALTGYVSGISSSFDIIDGASGPFVQRITRSEDYTEAHVRFSLIGRTERAEISREQLIVVPAGNNVVTQWGNAETFNLATGFGGFHSFADSNLYPEISYRYRARAKNHSSTDWTDWGGYSISAAQSSGLLSLGSPSNLQLSREHDNSGVTISWTAPIGDFDSYTLQRQELVIVESSTIFANVVTLDGNSWLPGSTTTFTDSSILPGNTYEYRVAAVKADGVGEYTDWTRSSPVQTSLGDAPQNLHFVESGSRMLDDRREFWMSWDELDGVDDYEVEVLVYDVATGGQSLETYIITDPTYFRTAYGRTDVRARGRKHDSGLCGSGADDRCYSEWAGWYSVRFTPAVTIPAPDLVDDTADTSIMELRENTFEAIETSLGAAGASVDADVVLQFLFVVAATVVGGISIAVAWRLGMAPLGVGMGAAIAVLVLFTGYRLYGIPLAWPVAMQAALAVAGMFALVRQTGVFR